MFSMLGKLFGFGYTVYKKEPAIVIGAGKMLAEPVKKAGRVLKRGIATAPATFETLAVTTPAKHVYHVELNRPKQRNAINNTMWREIGNCFESLGNNPDCRVIVLSGAGDASFSAGLDLKGMIELSGEISAHDDVARKGAVILKFLKQYQNSISSLEKCPKPVIAAIHGDCIGAGTDMITAADIRFCSSNAYFQVKEVDIGMAADVGTLQRLPKIIGSSSLVNELCYTGRKLLSDEARKCGLVSGVFDSKQKLIEQSYKLASEIALKSPVAVQTIKRSLIYSRDHGVDEGLAHIGLMNMLMIQSEDFMKAVMAAASKGETPTFSKL